MAEQDPVRARTDPVINDRIDRETMQRLRHFATGEGDDLTPELTRLDREWDIERALELNAAVLGLVGLVLGVKRDRRWLALPGVALSFLALHSTKGWCPPVPLLRRLGFRTQREIERERYAIKGMRGDFEGARRRSQAAWRAVR